MANTSELNNDFFTVERSINSTDWEIIGTVNGAGNSKSLINYSFIDSSPLSGTSYYRLKQTDFDSEFENTVQLKGHLISYNENLKVYPTLISNNVNIEIKMS